MKIAMIGAHGVGKTTLCFEIAAFLKKQDKNVEFVKEVARSCPLPINRETNFLAQSWILHTQIAEEILASNKAAYVLCDRSVIDNYAYLVWAAGNRPELDELITSWIKTYDHLWKVPITTLPTYDGIRDMDIQFQKDIDGLVDTLLDRYSISHRRLDPDVNRNRWIHQITDELLAEGVVQKSLFEMNGGL